MTNKKGYQAHTPFLLVALILAAAFCFLPLKSQAGAPFADTTSINSSLSLVPYTEILTDSSGAINMEEMFTSELTNRFIPLSEGIPFDFAGTLWLRFTLAPAEMPLDEGQIVLDLGSHAPKGSIIYTPKSEPGATGPSIWQGRRADGSGMYKLPSAHTESPTTIYVRIPGTPDLWFAPSLRTSDNAETSGDKTILYLTMCVLGVFTAVCLLRAFRDGGEWRLWTAVLAALILAQPILTIPSLPLGFSFYVNAILYMLIPAFGLALIPHIARHLWNTKENAKGLDTVLALFTLIGGLLPVLLLVPGFLWVAKLLPLWPVLALASGLLAFIAMSKKLAGSGRYLLCTLLLAAASLLTLLAQTTNSPGSILLNAPLWAGCIVTLLLGIIPLSRSNVSINAHEETGIREAGPALHISEVLDSGDAPARPAYNTFTEEDAAFLSQSLQETRNSAPDSFAAEFRKDYLPQHGQAAREEDFSFDQSDLESAQDNKPHPGFGFETMPERENRPQTHVPDPSPYPANEEEETGDSVGLDLGPSACMLSQTTVFNKKPGNTFLLVEDGEQEEDLFCAQNEQKAHERDSFFNRVEDSVFGAEEDQDPGAEPQRADAVSNANSTQVTITPLQTAKEVEVQPETDEKAASAEGPEEKPEVSITPIPAERETETPETKTEESAGVDLPASFDQETAPEAAEVQGTDDRDITDVALKESIEVPTEAEEAKGTDTHEPEQQVTEIHAEEPKTPVGDVQENHSTEQDLNEVSGTENPDAAENETFEPIKMTLESDPPPVPCEADTQNFEKLRIPPDTEQAVFAPTVLRITEIVPGATASSPSASQEPAWQNQAGAETPDLALGDFPAESEKSAALTPFGAEQLKAGPLSQVRDNSTPINTGNSSSVYFSVRGKDDARNEFDPAVLSKIEETLKVPLESLIRAASELTSCSLPPLAKVQSEAIVKNSQALAQLVNTLSHGGSEALQLLDSAVLADDTVFDLQVVLREAHDAVVAKAERRGLALSWFMPPHMPLLYRGNPTQLQNVLSLLLDSAIESTYRGSVQVAVRRLPDSIDPGHLVFTVTDSGQTSPHLRRSTTALMKAWEMVVADGGTLSLDSTPNQGTVVSFTLRMSVPGKQVQHLLPILAKVQEQNQEGPSIDYENPEIRPLTILVADEQTTNRQLVSFFLNDLPYIIEETRSADDALKAYTQSPVALVIFDGSLPDLNLPEMIKSIHEVDASLNIPPVPVIALVQDHPDASRAIAAGCQAAIRKPLSRTKVRDTVGNLLPIPEEVLEAMKPKPVPITIDLDDSKDETKTAQSDNISTPERIARSHPGPAPKPKMEESLQPVSLDSKDQDQRISPRSLAEAARRFIRVRKKPAVFAEPQDEYLEESMVSEARPISSMRQAETSPAPIDDTPEVKKVNHLESSIQPKTNFQAATRQPSLPETGIPDNQFRWSEESVSEPRPVQKKEPAQAPRDLQGEQEQQQQSEDESKIRRAAPVAPPLDAPASYKRKQETQGAPIITLHKHQEDTGKAAEETAGNENPIEQAEKNITIVPLATITQPLQADENPQEGSPDVAELERSPMPIAEPETVSEMSHEPALKADSPVPNFAEDLDPDVIHLIPGLLDSLDLALSNAFAGRDNGSFLAIAEACMRIAGTADAHGLRVIKGIANCVERAANANDMEAVNDLLGELDSSIQNNRKKLDSIYHARTGI